MIRYLRLLGLQLRMSALLTMQYRLDFLVDGLLSLFWTASSLVPLLVLFHQRDEVAGWTWPQALLVIGFFTILRAVIEGGIQPALQNVVENIRKGTLDFLLLKPADAQFLLSTSRFEFWRAVDVFAGFGLLAWALARLGRIPAAGDLLAAALLLVGAVVILYSLWILVISLAFYVVKVDNLTHFFHSIFDVARWPASIFRGTLAVVFTFVIPVAVMTTFPALALQGRLQPEQLFGAVAGAFVFFFLSRRVWLLAIRRYVSAGG